MPKRRTIDTGVKPEREIQIVETGAADDSVVTDSSREITDAALLASNIDLISKPVFKERLLDFYSGIDSPARLVLRKRESFIDKNLDNLIDYLTKGEPVVNLPVYMIPLDTTADELLLLFKRLLNGEQAHTNYFDKGTLDALDLDLRNKAFVDAVIDLLDTRDMRISELARYFEPTVGNREALETIGFPSYFFDENEFSRFEKLSKKVTDPERSRAAFKNLLMLRADALRTHFEEHGELPDNSFNCSEALTAVLRDDKDSYLDSLPTVSALLMGITEQEFLGVIEQSKPILDRRFYRNISGILPLNKLSHPGNLELADKFMKLNESVYKIAQKSGLAIDTRDLIIPRVDIAIIRRLEVDLGHFYEENGDLPSALKSRLNERQLNAILFYLEGEDEFGAEIIDQIKERVKTMMEEKKAVDEARRLKEEEKEREALEIKAEREKTADAAKNALRAKYGVALKEVSRDEAKVIYTQLEAKTTILHAEGEYSELREVTEIMKDLRVRFGFGKSNEQIREERKNMVTARVYKSSSDAFQFTIPQQNFTYNKSESMDIDKEIIRLEQQIDSNEEGLDLATLSEDLATLRAIKDTMSRMNSADSTLYSSTAKPAMGQYSSVEGYYVRSIDGFFHLVAALNSNEQIALFA